MSHQFLKKKFSFTRLFLRFFAVVVLLYLFTTSSVFAASDPVTSGVNSLSDFYKHITTLPKKNSPQIVKTQPKSQNINISKNNLLLQATAIAGQANIVAASVSDVASSWFSNYYDSYTSGLSSILYPVKNISLTKVTSTTSKTTQGTAPASPDAFAQSLGSSLRSATPSQKPTGLAVVSPASPQTKIVYVPGPQGPAGPQGPQGPKGDAGAMSFGSTITSSSPNPVAYMPVGITYPNPSANFTGGEYASIANLTSNLFTNNTSNIITLNVSGNQTVTGNSSITGNTTVGGTLSVTGAVTIPTLTLSSGTVGTLTITQAPTLPHIFTTWPSGTSNIANSSLYINPSSAVADSNLLGLAVNGAVKFLVDAEGDIYGNNLILTGSTTTGATTVASLTVNDNTTLGDAITDTITLNGRLNTDIIPLTDNLYNIGSTSNRWASLRVGTGASSFAGNVGVGTTGPLVQLDIQGSGTNATPLYLRAGTNLGTAGQSVALDFRDNSGVYRTGSIANITQDSSHIGMAFSVYNGGISEVMRILGNGNLGIGTTGPTQKLHINSGVLRISGGGADSTGEINLDNGTEFTGNAFQIRKDSSTVWAVKSATTGNDLAIFVDNVIGRGLTIKTSTGNVGIGTTAPAKKLEVVSDGTDGFAMSNGQGYLTTFKTVFSSGTTAANYLAFNVSGITAGSQTEKVRIQGDGNVGIGTTAPGASLHTYHDASADTALKIENPSGGALSPKIVFQSYTTEPASISWNFASQAFSFTSGRDNVGYLNFLTTTGAAAVERMRILNNGNVGIGTSAPSALLGVGSTNQFTVTSAGVASATGLSVVVSGVGTFTIDSNGISAPANGSFRASTGSYMGPGGFSTKSAGLLNFSSDTTWFGAVDTAIGRNAAGVVEINNGTAGQYRDLQVRSLNPTSGNVGIGTTAPGAKLETYGGEVIIDRQAKDNANRIGLKIYAEGSAKPAMYLGYKSDGSSVNYSEIYSAGAYQDLRLNASAGASSGVGGSQLVLTSAGNVGIGITAPAYPLQVSSGFVKTDTSLRSVSMLGSNEGSTSFGLKGGVRGAASIASSYFSLQTGDNATNDGALALQAFGGKVGIGDAAPGATLSVVGNASIGYSSGQTAPSNGLIIQGNVGIGTTGPAGNLQIGGGSSVNGIIANGNGSTNDALNIFYQTTADSRVLLSSNVTNGFGVTYGGNVGGIRLGSTGAYSYIVGNGTNLLLNPVSGNVGIGTTGPGAPLDVRGAGTAVIQITSNNAWTSGFELYNQNRTRTAYWINNSSDTEFVNSVSGGDIKLITAGTGDVLITNGNVGIGTTGPGQKLDVIGASGTIGSGGARAMMFVRDSTAQATGVGSGIFLQGKYNDAGDYTTFGAIYTTKNNGTTGDSGASLNFLARENGDNTVLNPDMVISTTGNVGIGTTAPTDKLQVSGNVMANAFNAIGGVAQFNSTGGVYMAGLGGSSYGAIQSYSDAGGTARLLALNPSGGNVGIGTTAPGRPLDVVGAQVSDGSLRAVLGVQSTSNYNGNPAPGIDFIVRYNSSAALAGIAGISGYKVNTTDGDYSGGLQFHTRNNGSSQAEVMRIDNLGNVGIGTTGPGAPLHVSTGGAGNVMISRFEESATANGFIEIVANGKASQLLTSNTGGNFRLATNATPGTFGTVSLAVDSSGNLSLPIGTLTVTGTGNSSISGNVGIGTTGPAQKLEVSGTIRQTGCTTAGTLSANVSGDIICTPSSQKFKNNITTLNTGLSAILALRPVSYTFKPEMNLGDGIHFGFISEEVANINTQFATHDAEGNPYGLDNNAILSATVNAIKELDLKIQPLSSLDIAQNGSLASLIRDYLENAVNGLRKIFVGEVNTKSLCVSDDTGAKTCITKSQLDALISGASGSVVNNTGGGSTPPPEPQPEPAPNPEPAPATCTDGIQNQDETGIDTGGVCTPVDNSTPPEPSP